MAYVMRRALQGLVVLACVIVVVFGVTRMIGDPVDLLLPLEATQQQRADLRAHYEFDRPLVQQFGSYLGGLARGDFGDSIWQKRPNLEIIAERLPNTLLLASASMALALLIALPLGTLAALRPNSFLDRVASSTSLLGLSVPGFWLGLLLILLFAVNLRWLPTSGIGGLDHLVLPAVTLALPTAGRLAMMTRTSMIEELNRPWIRVARSKGMPERRTVGVHAARNAGAPVVTLAGWEMIRMLAGTTVIVETVFAWPGIGLTAVEAIQRRDLFLLQTIVLVAAVVTVVFNIVIDLVYKLLDPRIELA